ncbi:MAG TPA: asparaginase [Acidimicrobiales bacterium]|nr:asparaginase [Acidimicrobiales bacterium]
MKAETLTWLAAGRDLPEITLISLGGTIASRINDSGVATPVLDGSDLIAAVPQLRALASLTVVSLRLAPSCEVDFGAVVDLARDVTRRVAAGADGVVVTHGTDTLEETAFALELLCDLPCPLVLTGAMRVAGALGSDGPANLMAAVRVAAQPEAARLGVLVVLNDEIHAARNVRKTHTTRLDAFQSPATGAVGWVAEDQVHLVGQPLRNQHVNLDSVTRPAFVALYKVGLGDDGRLLPSLGNAGVDGLVVEALGGGHVPAVMVTALAGIAGRMPVILASRTGAGEVMQSTYGYPGSEIDLLEHGLIAAGSLDGPKARVLLTLLLMAGAKRPEVEAAFTTTAIPGARR